MTELIVHQLACYCVLRWIGQLLFPEEQYYHLGATDQRLQMAKVKTKPCAVCDAKAAGFHFGVFSCEGCKSFFSRNYKRKGKLWKCAFEGHCQINDRQRTDCKACRMKKCLAVGMSRERTLYGRRPEHRMRVFNERNNIPAIVSSSTDDEAKPPTPRHNRPGNAVGSDGGQFGRQNAVRQLDLDAGAAGPTAAAAAGGAQTASGSHQSDQLSPAQQAENQLQALNISGNHLRPRSSAAGRSLRPRDTASSYYAGFPIVVGGLPAALPAAHQPVIVPVGFPGYSYGIGMFPVPTNFTQFRRIPNMGDLRYGDVAETPIFRPWTYGNVPSTPRFFPYPVQPVTPFNGNVYCYQQPPQRPFYNQAQGGNNGASPNLYPPPNVAGAESGPVPYDVPLKVEIPPDFPQLHEAPLDLRNRGYLLGIEQAIDMSLHAPGALSWDLSEEQKRNGV